MHITVEEIGTSLAIYTILHTIVWMFLKVEKLSARLIRNEYHRLIHDHYKHGHGGRRRHCDICLRKERYLETVAAELAQQ